MSNEGKSKYKSRVIMSPVDKNKFYDSIVENMIGDKEDICKINEYINRNFDPVIPYNALTTKEEFYNGIGNIFKLDGIINVINGYFARNKIDLKCEEYVINNACFLRFVIFIRPKEGGVSKIERKTERDSIEIVESSSKDSDKEKIAKKIEESRKLITEG